MRYVDHIIGGPVLSGCRIEDPPAIARQGTCSEGKVPPARRQQALWRRSPQRKRGKKESGIDVSSAPEALTMRSSTTRWVLATCLLRTERVTCLWVSAKP